MEFDKQHLEHFLTVSKIVEQKEVFERRFNYRKVKIKSVYTFQKFTGHSEDQRVELQQEGDEERDDGDPAPQL